mmetsp:Transcript_19692/g.64029  ORF Transcript_19692/g.64029 Transcript_19692/m.64029 type:complete len:293 (+) Transcript_19692:362-1240(+)
MRRGLPRRPRARRRHKVFIHPTKSGHGMVQHGLTARDARLAAHRRRNALARLGQHEALGVEQPVRALRVRVARGGHLASLLPPQRNLLEHLILVRLAPHPLKAIRVLRRARHLPIEHHRLPVALLLPEHALERHNVRKAVPKVVDVQQPVLPWLLPDELTEAHLRIGQEVEAMHGHVHHVDGLRLFRPKVGSVRRIHERIRVIVAAPPHRRVEHAVLERSQCNPARNLERAPNGRFELDPRAFDILVLREPDELHTQLHVANKEVLARGSIRFQKRRFALHHSLRKLLFWRL